MLRRMGIRCGANAWANRTRLQTGDWVCKRCGFVTPSQDIRCTECREVRSHDASRVNQMPCGGCNALNHAGRDACWQCNVKLDFNNKAVSSRMQRIEDIRIVKHWSCLFCQTNNLQASATCKRCHRVRQR